MLPRDLANFDAPKTDSAPSRNPQSELSAANVNRFLEDLSQLSRTCVRAHVKFTTTAAPGAATVVSRKTLWGDSVSFDPVVTNTGTGIYLVSFPAEFTDGLGVDETLSFAGGWVNIDSNAQTGFCRVNKVSAVSFEVRLHNTAGVASNLGGACNIDLFLV